MKNLGKVALITVLGLFLMAGSAATPNKAAAMCVYNKDQVWWSVYFDCGTWCNNNWNPLYAGQHACRPDKGGKVTVSFKDISCEVEVDKHGWVTITEQNMGAVWELYVTSYHEGGGVRQTCTRGMTEEYRKRTPHPPR